MPDQITYRSDPQVVAGPDGRMYELRIEGTAELTRGPLGRFLDLADEIRAEGLDVPPEITAVLDELSTRRDDP